MAGSYPGKPDAAVSSGSFWSWSSSTCASGAISLALAYHLAAFNWSAEWAWADLSHRPLLYQILSAPPVTCSIAGPGRIYGSGAHRVVP
jgi:hypothetical protein